MRESRDELEERQLRGDLIKDLQYVNTYCNVYYVRFFELQSNTRIRNKGQIEKCNADGGRSFF